MRSVALDFSKRLLVERDVDEPKLEKAGDVLFRVLEVGVCGTDRDLARFRLGEPPSGDDFLVLGHEAVGQIVASNAAGFSIGDYVVPTVRRACVPACGLCLRGRRDLCVTGSYRERGILRAHGYFTELAVDASEDLLRVHRPDYAVLIEPLSVAEKAIDRGLELHQAEPARALVLGAGAVGILSALALQQRGLSVDVRSMEPSDSARARLVEDAGIEYLTEVRGKYDVVIEASGSREAAEEGARSLAPNGVMIVLGAKQAQLSLIDMIIGNQTIAGSVNASPQGFRRAVSDLALFPRAILERIVDRRPFEDYRTSILSRDGESPKTTHAMFVG